MKALLWIVAFFGLVIGGCERPAVESTDQTKVVAAKYQQIENRVSGWDTLTGDGGIRTKSVTVNYLVAEDGTMCEVGPSAYFRTKEGDEHEGTWREK